MTLVVDASVVVRAIDSAAGFAPLRDDDLRAPALMWSEARSVLHLGLHLGLHRRLRTAEEAEAAHARLEAAPVKLQRPARLGFVVGPTEL